VTESWIAKSRRMGDLETPLMAASDVARKTVGFASRTVRERPGGT
jgi:hypothetical protein